MTVCRHSITEQGIGFQAPFAGIHGVLFILLRGKEELLRQVHHPGLTSQRLPDVLPDRTGEELPHGGPKRLWRQLPRSFLQLGIKRGQHLCVVDFRFSPTSNFSIQPRISTLQFPVPLPY